MSVKGCSQSFVSFSEIARHDDKTAVVTVEQEDVPVFMDGHLGAWKQCAA